ncbi:hypothetical protein SEUCBS139899_007591 [Sporothrix eucalyptigena]
MPTSKSTDDETGGSSQQPGQSGSTVDVRKQRKRDTDRLAQREHRKRQKQYVQDLEVELAFLKQQPTQSQISQLCEENKQLRQEVNAYRDTLSRIQSLLSSRATPKPGAPSAVSSLIKTSQADTSVDSPSSDGARGAEGPNAADVMGDLNHTAVHAHATRTVAATNAGLDITNHDRHPSDFNSDSFHGQATAGHSAQSILDLMRTTPAVENNVLWMDDFRPQNNMPGLLEMDSHFQTNPVQQLQAHTQPSQQQHMLWRFDTPHANTGHGASNSPHRSTAQDASWLLNLAPSPAYFRPSPLDSDSPSTSSRMAADLRLHRMTSCISTTPEPNDNGIYGIIDKVRSLSLTSPLASGKPTLAEFLLDNSSNVLSESLKVYLDAYRGTDKLAEFLGCYWTIYILLVLQMRVPHPVSIDFIAWPALRDELVKLSQVDRDKVCDVMRVMFSAMEVKLDRSLIHDLSNDGHVGELISDLRNWTLKEEFFETFPEYRPLCMAY